jgi:hypothetical protein
LAQAAAMVERGAKVGDLCKELGVTRQALYRSVSANCELLPWREASGPEASANQFVSC